MDKNLGTAHINSEVEMMALGAAFADILKAGMTIRLEGDLGAGKTTFARGIIRTLMEDAALDVPSPTFALVQPYEEATVPIWHFDLYRLEDEDELWELGFEEAQESAVTLIEWAEKAENHIPKTALSVHIMPDGGERTISFKAEESTAQFWQATLKPFFTIKNIS